MLGLGGRWGITRTMKGVVWVHSSRCGPDVPAGLDGWQDVVRAMMVMMMDGVCSSCCTGHYRLPPLRQSSFQRRLLLAPDLSGPDKTVNVVIDEHIPWGHWTRCWRGWPQSSWGGGPRSDAAPTSSGYKRIQSPGTCWRQPVDRDALWSSLTYLPPWEAGQPSLWA